jgi:hypothetical protein
LGIEVKEVSMKNSSEHPFENTKLHIVVKAPKVNSNEERIPFNDVIKHGDIVQGFQSPKNFGQIPKWYKKPVRIFSMISLLVFAFILIFQIIEMTGNVIGK